MGIFFSACSDVISREEAIELERLKWRQHIPWCQFLYCKVVFGRINNAIQKNPSQEEYKVYFGEFRPHKYQVECIRYHLRAKGYTLLDVKCEELPCHGDYECFIIFK